jgi:hypothetical protein
MKNTIKKIFVGLFAIVCISACNKNVGLDPIFFQPTTFANETQIDYQLAAVYGNFNIEQLYAQGLWGYFATSADECFRTDAATGTTTQVLTESYRGSSGEATYSNFWRGCYKGIEQCNVILDGIKTINYSSTAKKNNIIGQTLFLRAYFFYLLTSNFGDVVLKTIPSTAMGTSFNLPKTPSKQVYDFILTDMRSADTLVQNISTVGNTSVVTQSAVEAILARVCLTMAGNPINDATKYDEALFWANKVIASGNHILNATPLAIYASYPATVGVPSPPAYSNVFTNNMQNNVTYSASNSEGIWDAAFLSKSNVTGAYANTGFTVSQQLGALMGITNSTTSGSFGQSNINTYGYSPGTYRPFAKLYNLYGPGDLRRDWNISNYIYNGTVSGKSPLLAVVITGVGSGASATAKVSSTNKITSIVVDNGGSGYTTAPTVSFIGTAGSGATATAVVSGGKVTAINVINQGSSYLTIYDRPLGKWRREYETNLAGVTRINNNTSCNFPIIRYADVLLMAAEADLKKNGTPSAQAVEYYNQVRRRAYGSSTPTSPMASVDVSTFTLQDIMDERSRELCFEGVRRNDLIRWGIITTVMQNLVADNNTNSPASTLTASTITANNFLSNPTKYSLFPIPASEIVTDNALTQNIGW